MYALRRLISIGIELPPHTRVEQALTELQVLLRSVEDWQERAKICLDVKYANFLPFLFLPFLLNYGIFLFDVAL